MTTFINVAIGEIAIASETGTLRALLGSCVGLAIVRADRRAAGLAHILLAQSASPTGHSSHRLVEQPGRYADTAVEELFRLLGLAQAPPQNLTAHIAGGADMFDVGTESTVGFLNIAAVEDQLQRRGIAVASKQCGGILARRMTIDVATGRVDVETIAATKLGNAARGSSR